MNREELKSRYATAIAHIVGAAMPGEQAVVTTALQEVAGFRPDPRPRVSVSFHVWLKSDEKPYGLTSGENWHLKPEELVLFAEQFAESEPMQKKLADVLAHLPPDYPGLGRVVEFIRDELIAKEGGFGDF